MATRYRFGNNEYAHFVTLSVINWIDVFSRELYKEVIVESLKYCIREKGLVLHAWVVMSNHLHLIISSREGFVQSDIMRDFKKYTSRTIIKAIEENVQESRKEWLLWMFRQAGSKNGNNKVYHQFWKQDSHPIELSNNEMMRQRLDYLHENPVKAGLVWEAWAYKYSSAIDYYKEEPGLLPIERL